MTTLLATSPPARCAASRSPMTWQWRYSVFATDRQNQTVNLAKVTMWLFLTKARLKKGHMVTLLETADGVSAISALQRSD